MSAKAQPQQQMVAKSAKHVTPRDMTLIRRRNLVKAEIERLEKIEKRLKAAVEDDLVAECGKENVVVVEVKGTVLRLTKVEKDLPKYKELLDQLADEDTLKALLDEEDSDGNKLYLTHQQYVMPKILGRNTAVSNLTA